MAGTTIKSESKKKIDSTVESTSCSKQPSPNTSNEIKKTIKTHITIKYDVGFGNTLSIRGKGPNLSWDKGLPLKNIKADEWSWESQDQFTNGEFKILINDSIFEVGANHPLTCGDHIQYNPKFH